MNKLAAITVGVLLLALTALMTGCDGRNDSFAAGSDKGLQDVERDVGLILVSDIYGTEPLSINDIQSLIAAGEIDERLVFEEIEPDEDVINEPTDRPLIGVTRGATDNVGQILRVFSRGAEIRVLDRVNSATQLTYFNGIFINCGSHHEINARVLREYVYGGGVVYASDHAGAVIKAAFPGLFDYGVVSESLTVRNAGVVHGGLAAHMGLVYFDIIFDLGSWYIITQLPDDATIYIEGYIPRRGVTPLAISFNYGEGTVFFTSFHNSAQASGSMIDFIGYLVFRTLFVEAEEDMRRIAEEYGFSHESSVFGFFMQQRQYTELGDFAGYEIAAGQLRSGVFGEAVMNAPAASDSDMISMEASEGFDSVFNQSAGSTQPPIEQEHFIHTSNPGESFMLMIDTSLTHFIIEMKCPAGRYFYLNARGELLINVPNAPEFEPVTNRHGVIVRNAAEGDWGFRIIDLGEDGEGNTVAIGIAVSSN
ncbi:MAG: hypothetical protein FWC71_04300 [Defluviitaleaceae bacterium]|nr:hypothetical protein [Defluviitaleaceae bacterium]